jgi:endoglycosylceramidase
LDDYKRLKSLGANYQSIRLFASTIGADGSTTFPIVYETLDSMVSRAEQVGIYTEFKLTMYGGTPYNWENLWLDNANAQQNLIDGWQSIWTRYINEPSVIGYDLINEPEQSTLSTTSDSVFVCNYLNPIYQTLIDSLQSIDTNKFALIQPALDEFNISTGVVDYYEYPCSINRNNVLYAPHLYVKISYPYDVSGHTTRLNRFINEAQMHNAPLFIGEYGIPWNKADDGNTTKENQYSITEKETVSMLDSLKIGFSRPWFADDNAEASPQLNWALIIGTSGLGGNERSFITNRFSRPYPKATAGNILDYKFYFNNNRFEMNYTSNVSSGTTEIFTAKNRYFPDSLLLLYNNNCFLLDTLSGTFQAIYNPDNLNTSNFVWDNETEIININEWTNATSTVQLLNSINSILFIISEQKTQTTFSLYPNPTKGKISIEYEGMERIEVLDITGKLIYEIASSLSPRNDVVEIDISGFSKGVYFVKVSSEDGIAVERIVLE